MDMVAGVAAEIKGYRNNKRPEVLALISKLEPGLRVLEVGCGEGDSAAAVPGAAETWGIEPHQPSAAIASNVLNNVIPATFEQAKTRLPPKYFNLVLCNDVIEHMTEPEWFLTAIQEHMAPNAVLIGSVPNIRFIPNLFDLLIRKDWEYKDTGILDRTHIRFFTFKSLRRTLGRTGFSIKCLQGINPGFSDNRNPTAIVVRLVYYAFTVATVGFATDTRYKQIGFVAQV